jgi:hypothetical protein
MNKQRKKGNKKSRKKDAEFRPKRTASHMLQGNSEDVLFLYLTALVMVFIQHKDAFYLFRDSRPRSWKPGKQIQRIVDIRHATRFDTDGRMGEGEG